MGEEGNLNLRTAAAAVSFSRRLATKANATDKSRKPSTTKQKTTEAEHLRGIATFDNSSSRWETRQVYEGEHKVAASTCSSSRVTGNWSVLGRLELRVGRDIRPDHAADLELYIDVDGATEVV